MYDWEEWPIRNGDGEVVTVTKVSVCGGASGRGSDFRSTGGGFNPRPCIVFVFRLLALLQLSMPSIAAVRCTFL